MTRTSVAIFTDNDFEKVNGVTTALSAVLDHAPDDVDVRVYTAAALGVDSPDYLALESWGVGIPFYPEMRMYWPPYRRMLDRLAQDGVDVIHVTTPGPVGLAALAAARRLRLPLVGSFHTDLAEYTVRLSGSAALGAFMRHYMTWLYGRCERVLVPSRATVDLVVRAGLSPDHVAIWGRGVDTSHFEPARRSVDWRRRWRAPADRPVLLYVGRVSPEKGVDLLPDLHDELMRRGLNHRLVVVGDGPARETLARRCPDAMCLGTLGRQDLADVYASADLFVFPSRTRPATSCSKRRPRACPCWSRTRAVRASRCSRTSVAWSAGPRWRRGSRRRSRCSPIGRAVWRWPRPHDATPSRGIGRTRWPRSSTPTGPRRPVVARHWQRAARPAARRSREERAVAPPPHARLLHHAAPDQRVPRHVGWRADVLPRAALGGRAAGTAHAPGRAG